MILATIIFVATYISMLIFDKYKHWIALSSGVLFIALGILPADSIMGAIDFNVLLMMIGTMGLVSFFIESKMPNLLSDIIISKVPNVQIAAVSLALFAGLISAVVDNVATVLMVAPVALQVCKRLKTNPVPFIIGISVSSNLQGAATLVGDTTAIMLGSEIGMSFADFFVYKGKPSMFFVVEIGAVLSAIILLFIFRKERTPISLDIEKTTVNDYVPTVLLIGNVCLLICMSFVSNKPEITNGLISSGLFILGVIYTIIKNKSLSSVVKSVKEIDFKTLGLLLGLFIMIGGIQAAGLIDFLAGKLAEFGGNNVFLLYTIVVVASVLISAVIDNIPYVATMLPIITGIAISLGVDATPLYFGLLSGATLGGNITPIGASANITGLGILRSAGYEANAKDFCKISIPFTISAVVPAYILVWLLYGI